MDYIEPILMPFAMDDIDIEKNAPRERKRDGGGDGSETSVSNSTTSIVVRGSRIRLRILGIIAVTVIPVFAVMFVLLLALVILYSAVGVPPVLILGNLTGSVNATLGTLGHAVLYPNLTFNLRVAL